MNLNRPLAILLIAFTALAVFYSLIIPLFEGPDEDDHFRYAKFLADRRALPVQEFVAGGGEAGHQGWQPPLAVRIALGGAAPRVLNQRGIALYLLGRTSEAEQTFRDCLVRKPDYAAAENNLGALLWDAGKAARREARRRRASSADQSADSGSSSK